MTCFNFISTVGSATKADPSADQIHGRGSRQRDLILSSSSACGGERLALARHLSSLEMAGVFQFSTQETPAKQMAGRNEAENEVSGNKRPQAEGDRIAAAPSGVSFKSKLMNSSNPDSWVGFGVGRKKLKINPGDFQFEEGPNGIELLMSSDIKAQLCKA
ncbi:hypothetical protein ACOSQ4_021437 [Xanthoceras sorbifolium]